MGKARRRSLLVSHLRLFPLHGFLWRLLPTSSLRIVILLNETVVKQRQDFTGSRPLMPEHDALVGLAVNHLVPWDWRELQLLWQLPSALFWRRRLEGVCSTLAGLLGLFSDGWQTELILSGFLLHLFLLNYFKHNHFEFIVWWVWYWCECGIGVKCSFHSKIQSGNFLFSGPVQSQEWQGMK